MERMSQRLDAGEVVLIDGGTGTELELRDVPMLDEAWSAAGALSHPEVLQSVHESYLQAGAEVIIANTFACSRHSLEHVGLGDRFEEVNVAAIAAALAARSRAGVDAVVSGAIATAELSDSWPTDDEARRNYGDQARIQADAGAEMIALEMMRDIDHTRIVLDAVAETGLPAWVGYACTIDDGEPWLYNRRQRLVDAVRSLDGQEVELVSIMHTETADIDLCLDVVQEHWDGPTGVYAQTGEFHPPHWQFHNTISPETYAAACLRWVERGVQAVGGCCGIGPAHIAHLRDVLPSHVGEPT